MRIGAQTAAKGLVLVAVAAAVLVVLVGFRGGEQARDLPAVTAPVAAAAPAEAEPGTAPAPDAAVAPDVAAPVAASDQADGPAAGAPGSVEDLWRMVQADPENADLWRDLGVNYVNAHEYVSAAEAFAAAVELRPDDARLHADLGTALLYQGLVRIARTEYLRALEIDPELAEAHFNLGVTYSHSEPVDVEAALASWRLAEQFADDEELVQLAREYIEAYGKDAVAAPLGAAPGSPEATASDADGAVQSTDSAAAGGAEVQPHASPESDGS